MKTCVFEKVRIERRVSQQEVAVSMGLSLTAYRNKEKGRSKFFVDEVPAFCEAVGIELKEMVKIIFLD